MNKDKVIASLYEVKGREFVGEAGAGLVKVTVAGDMRVTRVEIDPDMFASDRRLDDLGFLADLFKSAVNQAIGRGVEGLMLELNDQVTQGNFNG